MHVEIMTKNDLTQFRNEIIDEMKKLIKGGEKINEKWCKTRDVCKLLDCSPGTIQNLRMNGSIEFTKIGGSLYYSMESINKIMETNKQNAS